MKKRQWLWWSLSLVLVVSMVLPSAGLVNSTVQAQGDIAITLAVPSQFRDIITDDLLAEFEAANPGVKVYTILDDTGMWGLGGPGAGTENLLDSIEEYVSVADVLYVTDSTLSTVATQAGYFLNMAPLASVDSVLNTADFYPALWESFQWDGGVWALPISGDVLVMTYNPDLFDAAGVAYPTANWTITDLEYAIRDLTQFEADGTVGTEAISVGDQDALFRSLLISGLYDSTVQPNTPQLVRSDAEEILNMWDTLTDEGYFTASGMITFRMDGSTEIPMAIQSARFALGGFGFGRQQETTITPQLLPGGQAVATAQGVAISSGTVYPEQAYALARFLTQRAEVANNFFSTRPARQSLVGQAAANDAGGPGGGGGMRGGMMAQLSDENEAFIEQAMYNALPASELRYVDYLSTAINTMTSDGIDANSALQEVELQAFDDMQIALDRGADLSIMVADPPIDVSLAPGEVALTFGYSSFTTPLRNQDEWDVVIDSFVANNASVGAVTLDTEMRMDITEMAENTDCFFLSYNAVTGGELDSILNLDPFLSTDPTFDRYSLVGDVLPQLQQNNMTYALPLMVQPSTLGYFPDNFTNAGLALPENGWTSDQFTDVLMTLKQYADDPAPFSPGSGIGGTAIQLLIAAYGGLPIDYRTDPPTYNFTDPVTVDAIRQVLDLAKEGYIEYSALSFSGGGAFTIGGAADSGESIWTENSGGMGGGPGRRMGQGGIEIVSNVTSYPVGNLYTPVSYNISTAYISANAENPQACYEFISELAQHPELFDGMPANRSQLSSPSYTASVSMADLTFYQNFDQLMQEPNTVVFPSGFNPANQSMGTMMVQNWLNGAFDAYVLEDADLEAELAEAESYAAAFQECTAQIVVTDTGTDEDQFSYMQQLFDCAALIDPSLADMVGG